MWRARLSRVKNLAYSPFDHPFMHRHSHGRYEVIGMWNYSNTQSIPVLGGFTYPQGDGMLVCMHTYVHCTAKNHRYTSSPSGCYCGSHQHPSAGWLQWRHSHRHPWGCPSCPTYYAGTCEQKVRKQGQSGHQLEHTEVVLPLCHMLLIW